MESTRRYSFSFSHFSLRVATGDFACRCPANAPSHSKPMHGTLLSVASLCWVLGGLRVLLRVRIELEFDSTLRVIASSNSSSPFSAGSGQNPCGPAPLGAPRAARRLPSATVGARPQETFHKRPNPEPPGGLLIFGLGTSMFPLVKPPNPKKPRVPWREAGCFLAWAPTVLAR